MNKNIRKSKKAFNRLAVRYNQSIAGRFTSPMKKHLENYLKIDNNNKILDVACGNGHFLGNITRKYEIEAYGIDIAEEMIRICKNNYPHIDFKVCDGIKIDFPDNTMDVITICAAFHHFPEPLKFLNEVYRVLKPGGKIYITEINVWGFHPIFNLFVPHSKNGDYKLYSPQNIIKLYQKSNFINSTVYKKFYTQIVSAEKPGV